MELALADAVANPVEAHVNGFGSFLFDHVIGDAKGCTVISDNCCRRLGITKLRKARTNRARFFTIVEESSKFGFSSTRDNFT